jgi:hypothetical protein
MNKSIKLYQLVSRVDCRDNVDKSPTKKTPTPKSCLHFKKYYPRDSQGMIIPHERS